MSKPTLPLFYDAGSCDYWLRVGERFMKLGKRDLEMHLEVMQIEEFKHHSRESLKLMDSIRFWAQTERCVDYAGPLAGHDPGLLKTADGTMILVTSGSKMADPVKGDPEAFEKFISELLPDGQAIQFSYWLKCACDSLEAGDFRPGQLVVLAGESGCGKSLMQDLITEILGGRCAKPMRYFIGETAFNSDMAEAEHWALSDDKGCSMDIRARRNFGEAIKEACVVTLMSVHAKGHKAITLPTWRRVTMSVNDESENLCKLPPMDGSILDKVFLFRCAKATIGADRKRVWKKLAGDIPALRWYLKKLTIPKALSCPRYGVKAWHHPWILEILTDMSPEKRLLALIDEILKDTFKDGPWQGTAMALEKEMRESKFSFAVEKLLSWSGAVGTYLGRLAHVDPERFSYDRTAASRTWTISKP